LRKDLETGDDSVRRLIHTYNSTLMLAEPLLLDLWQELGLTVAQIRILRWLGSRGPLGAGELAEATQISPASLARILSKLEESGLISRTTVRRDRRRVIVEMTSEGHDLLHGRGILRGTLFEEAAIRLDAKTRERLIEGLDTFHRALREIASDDAFEYPHAVESPET
jgi:MarR family transcriptional regulator for hemolysin